MGVSFVAGVGVVIVARVIFLLTFGISFATVLRVLGTLAFDFPAWSGDASARTMRAMNRVRREDLMLGFVIVIEREVADDAMKKVG